MGGRLGKQHTYVVTGERGASPGKAPPGGAPRIITEDTLSGLMTT